MRAIGFYISDWGGPGLTARDFDRLVQTGQIEIVDVPASASPGVDPRPTQVPRDGAPSGASDRVPASIMNAARDGLVGPRHPLSDAALHVEAKPGLYAIYGDDGVWHQLGL